MSAAFGSRMPMDSVIGRAGLMAYNLGVMFKNVPTSLIATVVLLVAAEARAATSDDLWAKAMLMSSDPTTSAEEVERLYLEAVKAASHKAPILVSLGDYFGGVMPMRQLVDDWTAKTEEDIEPEVEEVAKELFEEGSEPSEEKIEEAAERL